MGFGGTTEKLQKVASMAEDVYAKLNELRDQVQAMRETVERVDRRTAENRALLEALAAENDVDVDSVLTETAIEEAEDVPTGEPTGDGTADATSGPTDVADATDGTAADSPSTDDATDESSSTGGSSSTDD
jgi:outer membrane murein-binding lipoprotein Lpp